MKMKHFTVVFKKTILEAKLVLDFLEIFLGFFNRRAPKRLLLVLRIFGKIHRTKETVYCFLPPLKSFPGKKAALKLLSRFLRLSDV